MKAINDNSWFSKLKQILAIYLYELPSSHNILDLPPTKNAWKTNGQQGQRKAWRIPSPKN
jgi:hypothetical protein